MASKSLTWNGDAITAKLRRAQIAGVNKTMADAAIHAKRNHTWQNREGNLERSIDIAEPARVEGNGVTGVWGSKGVVYALIQELGGTIVPVKAKALAIPQPDGSVRFVKSVTIPARPYLRPAADAEYPNLVRNIRANYEGSDTSAGGPEA